MIKFIETANRIKVIGGWEKGIGELMFKGHKVSVWEDDKILNTDGGDGCTIYLSLNCALKNG